MAFLKKTVTLVIETPLIAPSEEPKVRAFADAYIRSAFAKKTDKYLTILRFNYDSITSGVYSFRRREYQTYTLTYTVDVQATDVIHSNYGLRQLVIPPLRDPGATYTVIEAKVA